MSIRTVKYHSPEWNRLTLDGWVTIWVEIDWTAIMGKEE